MAKRTQNSRPQASAASDAGGTTSAAPAGSAQEPATNSAVSAGGAVKAVTLVATGKVAVVAPDLVEIKLPLPSDFPDEALKAVSIVVTAKSEQGRWRTGRHFTRHEAAIPYVDLTADELDELCADAELVVSARIDKPSQEA